MNIVFKNLLELTIFFFTFFNELYLNLARTNVQY